MMKKYFTDGLIQVAILLSLLRTDLNSFINIRNSDSFTETQDVILGESLGYTQSPIHDSIYGSLSGHVHLKHVENYQDPASVFRELRQLTNHRSIAPLETILEAWLVSEPPPLSVSPVPSGSAPTSNSAPPQAAQVQHDDNNNDSGPLQSSSQGVVEMDVAGALIEEHRPFFHQGGELTKEVSENLYICRLTY